MAKMQAKEPGAFKSGGHAEVCVKLWNHAFVSNFTVSIGQFYDGPRLISLHSLHIRFLQVTHSLS